VPPNDMHRELPSANFGSRTAEKYSLINKDHHIHMDMSHVCVVKLKTSLLRCQIVYMERVGCNY
jgi:hypothetical protein